MISCQGETTEERREGRREGVSSARTRSRLKMEPRAYHELKTGKDEQRRWSVYMCAWRTATRRAVGLLEVYDNDLSSSFLLL